VLPRPGESVAELAGALALDRVDCTAPLVLARHQTYLLRLREGLALPAGLEGYANGKSSTGRVDLAVRVLCDGSPRFDRIPPGYRGRLWLELTPRSFDVVVRAGLSLTQVILFAQRRVLDQAELLARHAALPLAHHPGGAAVDAATHLVDGRLVLGADLDREVVGFVARRSHRPLDLSALGVHAGPEFFAPLPRPPSGLLFLEKDRFYILATRERVVVPDDLACEMVPFDATAGEFRAHYAGFFDPGWGVGTAVPGAPAVLEVRPHVDDLILRDGQPICSMAYEALQRRCARPYGVCGNNYRDQEGPRLSKHFRTG
jgi:dCTP deaminase